MVELGKDDPTYKAASAALDANLGWGITAAGILVALLAPVLGQRADASGRRKSWLGWMTLLLVACVGGLYFVEATPDAFWLGAGLIAVGSIVAEIANVNYYAMMTQVSTPSTMGRVSGLGWGLGYMGGIVALVVVVLLDTFDWFGMDTSNGMAYRLIAVGCAVWTLIFAWPLFAYVPETKVRRRPTVACCAAMPSSSRTCAACGMRRARRCGSSWHRPCTATASPASSRSARSSPPRPSASPTSRSSSSASPPTLSPVCRR
ncbi:hypothetical protein GCM10025876_19370 [Demequina litorisediminis]|uniref:Major Facilitator Superfamily protein n=1 Tax=Demequina litorisediminis TaxID=1849022 RepID=A0ABQ6IG73_9MICO|nr:hypothetical protein GCM10025876_19370 [Demequina litorisediminis]